MIRTLMINSSGQSFSGGEELIHDWCGDNNSRLWLDLTSEGAEKYHQERQLLLGLGCHALAIEDAQRDRHPPKYEAFEDHVFILYRGIAHFDSELHYQPQSVAFFISERLLISYHPLPTESINLLMTGHGGIHLQRCPAQLALRIMHTSAGMYLEHVLAFEDQLSDLEDALYEQGTDALMRQLMGYRSRLVKLRRVFNYHQSITDELKTSDLALFTQPDLELDHTLNDLHDRFERLASLVAMFYDICGDLIDGYLAVASHQLNNTMRVLTVITAIFIPLGFLAGLYGMNFDYIPELKVANGYFILLGVMATLAVGLLVWFRKLRWL
ncbi:MULTISPECIES: magnesium transporter CorA family protein [unclassified Oceanobacter]|uniref:magnesium transporter CorA family protein n=1 Tax=unclassified Oceanobacter TaxID=2620260 RepID=UPI002735DF2A|nr:MULTISPECIES: magnesium transporter CorA family protein [unclassified Oceanobacter]MDP2505784.1 magnesium transporter CorA family protein [Oceanobacter sp. 3_MG-2023]MDP2547389.1 magnesium transporter CorA family protein [Oceanobacter sp. 4_MG-2023]